MDKRMCPCQKVAIAGSPMNPDVGIIDDAPEVKIVPIRVTLEVLYKDWVTGKDKYGLKYIGH